MNKIKAFFHKSKRFDTEQNIQTSDRKNNDNNDNTTNVNMSMSMNMNKKNIVNPTTMDHTIEPIQISAELETQDIPITTTIPQQQEQTKSYSFNENTRFDDENDDNSFATSDSNLSLISSDFESEYSYVNDSTTEENIFSEQLELKDYKLNEKIGEGAFSKVYRGTPLESSYVAKHYKQVAIKVIKKDILTVEDNEPIEVNGERHGSSKTSTREQVLKEVALHKQVSPGCKNIVQFIDFQETPSYYYIVQELLNGGEIFNEIVKLTYLSEDLTRHIAKQLGNAIKHLHLMGVVHRDIKPENLLFNPIEFIASPEPRKFRKSDDPNSKADEGVFVPGIGGGGIGIVKLADFGLSKQIYQTNTKTPCGTVGYTAPEVVKDEMYSMKVDMWGIGCVLYTMLCGFPPFYDDKINILTEKISRGEYTFLQPWWDEISDGAKRCVRKLLEVDPGSRYDIDEFLNDPWLNQYDCEIKQRSQAKRKSKAHHHHNNNRRRILFNQFADKDVLYSPAAVAMRDAFDISNAVARIEEERMQTPIYGLGSLAEDDEAASLDEQRMKEQERQQERQQELENKMFHLKLDTSTIVMRRKQKKNSIP